MNISKPNRKKCEYTQHLLASPETVFPLLCPVREVDWVPDWMPASVLTKSGVCEQECIFITPPEFESEHEDAIWVVTNYDDVGLNLAMYKIVPQHSVSKLLISLSSDGSDTTNARISYEITSIGPRGVDFLEDFTEAWYEQFMLDWQNAMNHYLEKGVLIS
jgi:hypothetical protein